MNFFKRKTTWTNSEIALLKICLVSCGITAGILFGDNIRNLLPLFFWIYIVTGLFIGYLWIIKSRK